MKIKLSILAAVLVSFSAQAELQCERAKRDITLNGQAHTERLVNIRQNGAKVVSENFENDLNYRDSAADACAKALASSRCEDTWVKEVLAHTESDGLGHGLVAGIPAHMGSKNSVTGGVYIDKASCENSRLEMASDAIDQVKKELRRERSRIASERANEIRYQNDMAGRGPKF